jgi:hypothetical protein
VRRSKVGLDLDLAALAMWVVLLYGEVVPSGKSYWHMVEPRFQPCVAEDLSPCPISISGAAFPRHLLVYSIAAR